MPALQEADVRNTPTKQIRIAVDVVNLARIVAAYHEQEPGDFLSDYLRPVLTDLHSRAIARQTAPKKGGAKQ